jgi:hypothetical protein
LAFNSQKIQPDPEVDQRTMNILPPIVYTVAAFLFFGLGYVVGNMQGDAATYRSCAYAGESTMVNGEEIKCSILVRPPQPPAPPPVTPTAPQNSRPIPERPFPPAGFEKINQG